MYSELIDGKKPNFPVEPLYYNNDLELQFPTSASDAANVALFRDSVTTAVGCICPEHRYIRNGLVVTDFDNPQQRSDVGPSDTGFHTNGKC